MTRLHDLLQHENITSLTPGILAKFLFAQFKGHIIMIIMFYLVEMICRLGFTILLQELFTKVSHLEEGNNKRDAYLYAVFSGVVMLIAMASYHNGFYEVSILIDKVRSEIVFLIYTKLSKMSQYIIKNQEVGKIINLLSNDFNLIEYKGAFIFTSIVAPFALAGIIAILVTRFGWPGILIFCVIGALIPIQVAVGKINSKYF